MLEFVDFDTELVEQVRVRAKRQIRSRMRALRRALPASAIAARSARIVERLLALDTFGSAATLGLFWPIADRGEVDLRSLDAKARAAGKIVCYPGVEGPEGEQTPAFVVVDDVEQLVDRGGGYPEPAPGSRAIASGAVDLAVLPALAASPDGHRLGYGSGFYDRLLASARPRSSVVVVFDFQLLMELPVADHDVAASRVVTDSATV